MRCGALVLIALGLLGCKEDEGRACVAPEQRPSCPPVAPSYANDVVPILEAKCNSCHDGTQDAWPLTDYHNVSAWAAIIYEDVIQCAMPPAGSPALTLEESTVLLEWLACGTPLDPVDAGVPSVIGRACIPSTELEPSFSGASASEVVLGTSQTCGDQLCLANHFQGRVSCSYGQTEAEIASLPGDAPQRCHLPSANGALTLAPVDVEVPPQLAARRADQVVTCSCQCDGPVPSSDYCTCPEGMECALLVEGFAEGNGDSYCIKSGTAYDPAAPSTLTCDKTSTDPATHCGGGDQRRNP